MRMGQLSHTSGLLTPSFVLELRLPRSTCQGF